MTKRVRIGGIGKSPAINKINGIHELDVKMLVADKMEEIVCIERDENIDKNNDVELNKIISNNIPLKFD